MKTYETLNKYEQCTVDDIINMYLDAGAMGEYKDCSEEEWDELSFVYDVLQKYDKYTDDEIVDMYLDVGAMGKYADCSEDELVELGFVYGVRCKQS